MDKRNVVHEPIDTEDSNQNIQDVNSNVDVAKMERKKKNREDREKNRSNIVRSGNVFITFFYKERDCRETCKQVFFHYFEQVLHSIFFFGNINCPPIAPKEFLTEKQLETFKDIAPNAFNQYNTHFPRNHPYSIFLEYLTIKRKPEDPDLFMKELVGINEKMCKVYDPEGNESTVNEFTMAASVVCFSYIKDPSDGSVVKWACGSSLSCKGKFERQIMIDISALYVWDKAISYAVCCEGNSPPITFPEQVHSRAYRHNSESGEYNKIPPCTKCFIIFDLKFDPNYQEPNKEETWLYGNCGEYEAVSRLVQGDEDVRREICIRGEDGEILMDRDQIENKFKEDHEEKIKRRLKRLLTPRKFKLPLEGMLFTSSYPISDENCNIPSCG